MHSNMINSNKRTNFTRFLYIILLSIGHLAMCFAEIGEYANEGYTVFCDNIHAVIACWCFILFDFFFIFAQFGLFLFFFLKEKDPTQPAWVSHAEWALLGWMTISAILFVTGPIGLGFEKARFFCIYKWRVFLSMFRAVTILCFYASNSNYDHYISKIKIRTILVSVLWTYGFVTYAIGFHVCRYTHHYIKDHYRGYDDVDPTTVAEFERVMQDAINAANKPKKKKPNNESPKRSSPIPSGKEKEKKN